MARVQLEEPQKLRALIFTSDQKRGSWAAKQLRPLVDEVRVIDRLSGDLKELHMVAAAKVLGPELLLLQRGTRTVGRINSIEPQDVVAVVARLHHLLRLSAK